ncbi:MAG: UDP-N-acetylglucosamine 1-carboxyvinyltransferase [Desulfobacterales bacterium]|jgi:UDP-N-acetylglucosamine 1-carboxyvinyltransferase|nr:UDP-N-acetylglucosamine 1-carboxyvinyltransferase [Desulfobacteraceae bacterium]MBT4363957.1 UDP-N-acetylglucosamine 1-carboxyvinyltransferase [Desulfobacteraceae bacterium]MBT7086182.1 UDP-N-acetylglucosamine 1-carboxyvinyltransferase [Desulfobacterales bacterium]MBT7698592.1 UDP-N-acetylglucosamine 1-carboxyvinyltransferase [Desulfobacterales bacterium]
MDKIVIESGQSLEGEVKISGAKNAALPILASSLLTDGQCTYHNVPNLRDIESIKQLLSHLGAKVESEGDVVWIDSSGLYNHEAPYELVRKMRASILVLCPLVARLKKARVSLPGGCAIGARPINFHLKGLESMGAHVELEHGYVNVSVKNLKGAEIYFDIPSVTGTENLLMAAALADGITILRNAAREPEVIALIDVLNQMGADIKGAGTSKIIVTGVSSLKPVSVKIIPDRIETGTFMVASAITGGDIKILDCEPDHIGGIIDKIKLSGSEVEIEDKSTIRVRGTDEIKSIDIKTLPYPGFPTDMQAQFMVLMSVARGTCIITETIFENRFIHVSELRRLGADITISGNIAIIKGVTALDGAPVMATDLRASASLILAGLVANGATEVSRVYHLDRGYEYIEKKLEKLGAAIKRVK